MESRGENGVFKEEIRNIPQLKVGEDRKERTNPVSTNRLTVDRRV